MKTKAVKSVVALFAALFTLGLAASGWAACVRSDDGSGTQSFILFAGQTIDAGTVSVTVNGDYLDVVYTTTNGWELTETHLWVGINQADMPQTRKGNPIPGRFPHTSGDITGATSYTFSISLSHLASTPRYMMSRPLLLQTPMNSLV